MTKTFRAIGIIDGHVERWTFGYFHDGEHNSRAYWWLRDPSGYVRTLERTWIDSVPRIHTILANHELVARIS